MTPTIAPYAPQHLDTLRQLASDPSLADDFDVLQSEGALEQKLADPFLDPEGVRILNVDGQPAGFTYVFILKGRDSSWGMIRIGVLAAHRRRGLGSHLLEDALAGIRARHPHVGEAIIGAWDPSPAAEALAARHGFRHVRNFWLMDRPLGPVPSYQWPAGVSVRTFDGSEAALHDWNDVYLRSFAQHWHKVVSTLEDTRHQASQSDFRPDGLFLAYRNGSCVGFTRNLLRERDGEVALIGTAPEARGIGLGRAMLRHAVEWIQAQRAPRVVLRVDGENDGALSLYRAEGFATARTRKLWSRPLR